MAMNVHLDFDPSPTSFLMDLDSLLQKSSSSLPSSCTDTPDHCASNSATHITAMSASASVPCSPPSSARSIASTLTSVSVNVNANNNNSISNNNNNNNNNSDPSLSKPKAHPLRPAHDSKLNEQPSPPSMLFLAFVDLKSSSSPTLQRSVSKSSFLTRPAASPKTMPIATAVPKKEEILGASESVPELSSLLATPVMGNGRCSSTTTLYEEARVAVAASAILTASAPVHGQTHPISVSAATAVDDSAATGATVLDVNLASQSSDKKSTTNSNSSSSTGTNATTTDGNNTSPSLGLITPRLLGHSKTSSKGNITINTHNLNATGHLQHRPSLSVDKSLRKTEQDQQAPDGKQSPLSSDQTTVAGDSASVSCQSRPSCTWLNSSSTFSPPVTLATSTPNTPNTSHDHEKFSPKPASTLTLVAAANHPNVHPKNDIGTHHHHKNNNNNTCSSSNTLAQASPTTPATEKTDAQALGNSTAATPLTPVTPMPTATAVTAELDKQSQNLIMFNKIPRQWPASQETLHQNYVAKAAKKSLIINQFDSATAERIDRVINNEKLSSRASKEKLMAERREAELEQRGFFDPARRWKGRDVYPRPSNWVYCRRTKNNWFEKTKILDGDFKMFKTCILGKGHHGDVVKGQELSTGQDLAIKVLHKNVTRRLGFVMEDPMQEIKNRRLLNEAWFMDFLKKGNGVCKLRRVVETETKFYFIMDLAQSDLNLYSNGINMREIEIRQVMKPVFECLEYAHRHEITHRDVKPENILLYARSELVPPPSSIGSTTTVQENHYSRSMHSTANQLNLSPSRPPAAIGHNGPMNNRNSLSSLGSCDSKSLADTLSDNGLAPPSSRRPGVRIVGERTTAGLSEDGQEVLDDTTHRTLQNRHRSVPALRVHDSSSTIITTNTGTTATPTTVGRASTHSRVREYQRFDSCLGDWGLASEHDCNSGRKPVGTPLYASPEVVRKMKRIRRREWINYKACDMWSLGVTMFVVASGTYPYHIQDALEAQAAPNWGLLKMAGMSDDYVALTQRLMALTAELRPSAQEALQDPWFKIQLSS